MDLHDLDERIDDMTEISTSKDGSAGRESTAMDVCRWRGQFHVG